MELEQLPFCVPTWFPALTDMMPIPNNAATIVGCGVAWNFGIMAGQALALDAAGLHAVQATTQLARMLEGIEQLLGLVYVCADCEQIWMPEELGFADEQLRCPECNGVCAPLEDIDG